MSAAWSFYISGGGSGDGVVGGGEHAQWQNGLRVLNDLFGQQGDEIEAGWALVHGSRAKVLRAGG